MNSRNPLLVIRRHLAVVVLITVAALVLGGGLTLLQKPEYAASAKVFVSTSSASTIQDLTQGNTFTQQIVQSYAEVAVAPVVLDRVRADLHLPGDATTLADQVTATASTDTVVITITATARQPQQAADIANAVSHELSAVVDTLTRNRQTAASPVQISPIQRASAPLAPASPNVPLDLILSAFFGLLIAYLVAVALDVSNVRMRSAREVEQAVSSPVLGEIPYDATATATPVVAQLLRHRRAEAYRTLRASFQFVDVDGGMRSAVITSPNPAEGKSTTVANLGVSLAAAGSRVLLIDGDLRRPTLADAFGLDGGVGLTDVLAGITRADDAIQQWQDSSLSVLPAGTHAPNPSELLQSAAMAALVADLRDRFDVVLFDAPPILPVADAALISRMVGGVLVVAAAGATTRTQLTTALERLDAAGARRYGIVLTMVRARRSSYDAYAYDEAPRPSSVWSRFRRLVRPEVARPLPAAGE